MVHTPRSASSFDTARLGFIIPKRLATKAVTRNTIKRVLREAFRLQRPHLPSIDLVFRLHSRIPDCSLRALRKMVRAEADQLLAKLKAPK